MRQISSWPKSRAWSCRFWRTLKTAEMGRKCDRCHAGRGWVGCIPLPDAGRVYCRSSAKPAGVISGGFARAGHLLRPGCTGAHDATWIDPLLFTAGGAQAFFVPLLGALGMGLVGHGRLNRTMGSNQSWNHAGNLASALLAIGIVGWFGVTSIFYAVAIVSVLRGRQRVCDSWRRIKRRCESGKSPNDG